MENEKYMDERKRSSRDEMWEGNGKTKKRQMDIGSRQTREETNRFRDGERSKGVI